MSTITKAWSTLVLKSVDEELGIIRGIASTPSTDLAGDVVEPKGAEFTLPIPLLDQHRHENPIGHVTSVKTGDDGIEIEAKIAKDSGLIYVDKVWKQIKAGLVRGLSIGFRALEYEPIKDSRGMRYTKWAWLELSAVTIPANSEASISLVKSVSEDAAESGNQASDLPVNGKYLAAKQRASKAIIGAKRTLKQKR